MKQYKSITIVRNTVKQNPEYVVKCYIPLSNFIENDWPNTSYLFSFSLNLLSFDLVVNFFIIDEWDKYWALIGMIVTSF